MISVPRFRLWRLLLVFMLPQTIYALIAYLTEAPAMTGIENMLELAIAGGICAAYIPGTVRFMLADDTIEPADWLGLGVVLTWTAGFLGTMFSIIWRSHGQPMSWINSDVTTYIKFMYICGGACHLLAPGALKRQMPTERWIQLGIAIAVAMFLSLVVAWAADVKVINLRSLVTSYATPPYVGDPTESAIAGPPPAGFHPQQQRYTPMDNLLQDIIAPGHGGYSARIEARVSDVARERLDDWMAQNRVFNRSEAVPRLLDEALDVEDKAVAEPYQPERR